MSSRPFATKATEAHSRVKVPVGFNRRAALGATGPVSNASHDSVPGVDVLLSDNDQFVESLGPVHSQLQEPFGPAVGTGQRNWFVNDGYELRAQCIERRREITVGPRFERAPHSIETLLRHSRSIAALSNQPQGP